jgi:hypothetical protein
LRSGPRSAFGQLTLGSFLIVGFMIHNVTEGLGIAAPAADGGATLSLPRLVTLAAIAGGPAILGAWTGGFIANDVLAVLFFGAAAGAAFEGRLAPTSRRKPAAMSGSAKRKRPDACISMREVRWARSGPAGFTTYEASRGQPPEVALNATSLSGS